MQQQFLNIVRGRTGQLLPPVPDFDKQLSDQERAVLNSYLRYSAVGNRDTVREKLQSILDETQADELIISGMMYEHQARLRSYEIVAEIALRK
jgi:alkanesulfonate monooxygenase SsuD/methylene tetrahydromethanopterin reductase-like flavin-dependent oxidoreductase (luciferase family)